MRTILRPKLPNLHSTQLEACALFGCSHISGYIKLSLTPTTMHLLTYWVLRGGGRYEKLVVLLFTDPTKNVGGAKGCLLSNITKVGGAIVPPAPPVPPPNTPCYTSLRYLFILEMMFLYSPTLISKSLCLRLSTGQQQEHITVYQSRYEPNLNNTVGTLPFSNLWFPLWIPV